MLDKTNSILVKTVLVESVPRAEQVLIVGFDGVDLDHPYVATVHRSSASASVFTILAAGRKTKEVKATCRVTYSRDLPAEGVARCSTEGHGPKAQRPGGIFFCRACYREQQKAYRQRKGAPAATRLTVKAEERNEKVERLLSIAPKSLTELRDGLLRNVAAAAFYSDEAKVQRLAELAAMYGLTENEVAQIVAA